MQANLLRLIQNAALSLSALTLEYNLILALVLHASRLFLLRLFSHLPLSNRGGSQFGGSDTTRKCQTPGVPFDQLTEPEEPPKIRAHKNCW
jgi:hypothetical protein